MPRLTRHDYLSTRSFLAQIWEQSDAAAMAVLPGYAQRDLHDFYAFTMPMSDDDALAHRTEMTVAFPSLPHSAGRALGALRAHAKGRPHRLLTARRKATSQASVVAGFVRTVRVDAVSRPAHDAEALGRTLRQLADSEGTDV
jgi:hypothetical protein